MTVSITNKISQITTDCVYRIATGAWAVGTKLPSLRQGTEIWNVDPLTVKRAYEALEARSLVEIVPRSGVYVRDNAPVYGLRRHLGALDALYASVKEQINRETGLSALGAFRYLAELAEQRASVDPECAFVECTAFQSRQLADEVARTVGVPCSGIALGDLSSGQRPMLPSERVVLTTGFHHSEVSELLCDADCSVLQIAVRFCPQRAADVVGAGERFVVMCLDAEQGALIADEVRSLVGRSRVAARAQSVTRTDAADAVAAAPAGEAVLASPSVWEAMTPEQREQGSVFPYAYSFDDSAVRIIATALGLPLGGTGCRLGT